MRNNLGGLNDLLFEQVERLNNGELKGEELKEEMERCRAISGLAKDIISNGSLALQARKFSDERMDIDKKTPKMLEG